LLGAESNAGRGRSLAIHRSPVCGRVSNDYQRLDAASKLCKPFEKVKRCAT